MRLISRAMAFGVKTSLFLLRDEHHHIFCAIAVQRIIHELRH